jgi:hypothetical protein
MRWIGWLSLASAVSSGMRGSLIAIEKHPEATRDTDPGATADADGIVLFL